MGQKLRELRCQSFDELRADVLTLRQRGYERGGEWDLTMVQDHLSRAIVAPLDGEGPKLFPPLTWIARAVIRRMARRQKYPSFKFPAPKFMQPRKQSTPESADAAFDAAIARANAQTAPTVTTRAFGTVETSDWRQMQLLHACHHLAFLKPKP